MRRLLAAFGLLLCLLAPVGVASAAYDPLGDACDANANKSAACEPSGEDPLTGKNGVFRKVSLVIAVIGGVVAIIIIIIAGLQFATSGGDPQKVASARTAILGAVIGLVVIAAAQGIVMLVLREL
jgi:hypothetical protein